MNRSQLVRERRGAGREEERSRVKDRESNERERLGQVHQGISLQLVKREEVGRRRGGRGERRIRKLKTGFCMNKPFG